MGDKKVIAPNLYITCDQRRKRADGTSPVRLRVRYNGIEKIWGLNIYLTQTDFNQTRKKYITGNYLDDRKRELMKIKAQIDSIETEAKEIISKMPVFTIEEFEHLLFYKGQDTLFTLLNAKIVSLIDQGRAGNATTYQSTLNLMKLFLGGESKREGRKVVISGGKDIPLTGLTAKFLGDFERWLLSKTKSDGSSYSQTTVGINVRNLRVIINEAIAGGILPPEANPFGKNKYRIPSSKKRKLALTLGDIDKIMKADLIPDSLHERCRDYWIFLYLTGGMNVKDMARLRYEDIDSEKITYIRAKTAYKKLEEPEFISIPLFPEVGRIIDRWGRKPSYPQQYVFPILEHYMTPMEERKKTMSETKKINTYIQKVANMVGVEGKISTYTARHSFSTILKNSGVPVEAISEALGHSSTKVTQAYLKEFEVEEKRKMFRSLLPNVTK